MLKLPPVAKIAIGLPIAVVSTAHASFSFIPLGPLAAAAALRSLQIARLPRALLDFQAGFAPPRRLPARRDLDDVVRDWVGGSATFYLGQNLAHGDCSAVKTFGLKLFLD